MGGMIVSVTPTFTSFRAETVSSPTDSKNLALYLANNGLHRTISSVLQTQIYLLSVQASIWHIRYSS